MSIRARAYKYAQSSAALDNAGSIAGLMLTTEVMISDRVDKKHDDTNDDVPDMPDY